jgi:hypothetical protein
MNLNIHRSCGVGKEMGFEASPFKNEKDLTPIKVTYSYVKLELCQRYGNEQFYSIVHTCKMIKILF